MAGAVFPAFEKDISVVGQARLFAEAQSIAGLEEFDEKIVQGRGGGRVAKGAFQLAPEEGVERTALYQLEAFILVGGKLGEEIF